MTDRNLSDNAAPTAREQELIKLILKEGERISKSVVGSVEGEDTGVSAAPLSFAQQRLWFIEQLSGGLPLYNIVMAVRFDGRLDAASLESALDGVVRRHKILSTTFRMTGEQPVQIVGEAEPLRLAFVDLQELPEGARADELRRLASDEARRGFDLTSGPLLRASLLRLDEAEHVVLIVMHHIVSDGWSTGILLKEVAALYALHLRGDAPTLPELPIQYADFAVLQRAYFKGAELEDLLAYWRKRLTDAPKLSTFPTDRARPAVQSFRGASGGFFLSRSLTEKLKRVGQEEGASLFITMLAAFNALLLRYTGQTDLVVGTPVAGRNFVLTEDLIGCFINTLALHTDASGDPDFRSLLRRVRETALEAFEFEDAPFEKVVEDLQLERDLSLTPLFQVMFVMQNTKLGSLELPDLKLTPLRVGTGTSKFDLTLLVEETAEGLRGAVEYSTDLFDASTIERMLGHFRRLLESIAADPDMRVSLMPMLSESERRQMLVEWNDTRTAPRPDVCLHELFEAQAAATPDALAVVFNDERLTYRELNESANRLAHYLRSVGVGADSCVGVLLERSTEMVVALLGVLKAGGAYVPLDPEYPHERLLFMLEDAGVRTLLTQAKHGETLPACGARPVYLDAERQAMESFETCNPQSGATALNLAYVIYTSGSTGKPKAAMNTHAGIVNRLAWMQEAYSLDETDGVLQKTPFSFDVSVWEFFWPLMTGARLVVARAGGHRDNAYLRELVIRNQVTTLHFVPVMLQLFLDALDGAGAEELTSLRRVICSGETLGVETVERFFAQTRGAQLYNLYGPTEAAIDVTHWTCAPGAGLRGVPIGRPVANTQIYLLDGALQPVAVGVSGELHIGGVGLGRGYLGRPDLTAEKFIPDPFSREGGARLYRTGDLARYLPDGAIEFLGRLDNQVKLRGFRIDLGEIESVLAEHASVRECVAALCEDAGGDKRLVVYTTLRSGIESPPTTDELRGFLKRRLPEHMIPSAFITLEKFPLTANGKTDRRRLPAPDAARPTLTGAFIAPRSEIEARLAAIWSEVLGVERVGVRDNFFELGGDSIRSIRVLALAKARGLNITLQQLFQHQTIDELVREIALSNVESATAATAACAPFSLVRDEDRAKLPRDVADAFPLTMMQAGMLYHMAYLPDHVIYHNVYSFQLRARFDLRLFQEAAQRVAARHAMLRTFFDLTNYSEPLQLVSNKADFPIAADDISHLSPDEQEHALDAFVEQEKWHRFDVRRPPLVRFHFHVRSKETFNFTFSECHPVVDGWSLHSLLAEFFSCYFALLDGNPAPDMKPLSGSYADFVRLERTALESQDQKRFWEERLSGHTVNELPRWPQPAPPEGAARIKKLSLLLSVELSEKLWGVARRLRVPLKSVLLAAHLKTMGLLSGQTDVLTGLVSVGRPEEGDGDSLLGLFFNTLPLRQNLSAGTWADLIRNTFENETEMLPFRRYPMAAIQKDNGRKPLFESVFNYLHFHVLDDVFKSGNVELVGQSRAWEETNIPLSTAFMLPSLSKDIQLMLSYDTARFSAEQAAAIGLYYKNTLTALADDCDARHDRASILPRAELSQILSDWNATEKDFSPYFCAHQLFEQQAASTPDALAVVFEDERLTYRELNARANKIAHYLRRRGVEPEMAVGICLERSLEMLVCILGVLKAGGAYLPLDPASPAERNAAMLAEIGAPVLITRRELGIEVLAAEFPSRREVLLLDADREHISLESEDDPPARATPDNLAYIFFTSGSTGMPKGVAVEHGSLFNYVRAIVERLDLPAAASYAMVSTFTTDLAHTVVFPTLSTGGTLHIIPRALSADAAALARYFERNPVDYLKIVPTHLSALLASPVAARVLPRRGLILGGEASSWSLVDTAQRLAPACVVHNHYGPTETTVGVLTYRVEQDSFSRDAAMPPLGRPLANTEIYILDSNLQPLPATVGGEVYIGGRGLARGYSNRPELTAERFVPHPFSARRGARLYRTGDLARFLPDGNIEFLGRTDHQVKIRGYRIELGEIEAALESHAAVREVVAVVREDAGGDKRLVAYVAMQKDSSATISDLRAHAKQRLPDYMLPSAFVTLDAMPLTPSGKVNRDALPRPESLSDETDSAYVAPQSDAERTIAALWQEALQLERVGTHDNFFDLGGHSLVLLQIQSKLREVSGRDISIVELFEYPTVSSLAAHLNRPTQEPSNFKDAHEQAALRKETLKRRSLRHHSQHAASAQQQESYDE